MVLSYSQKPRVQRGEDGFAGGRHSDATPNDGPGQIEKNVVELAVRGLTVVGFAAANQTKNGIVRDLIGPEMPIMLPLGILRKCNRVIPIQ